MIECLRLTFFLFFCSTQGLRVTALCGALGTCAGAWIKVFSVHPDLFYVGFIGVICDNKFCGLFIEISMKRLKMLATISRYNVKKIALRSIFTD